MRSVEIKPDRRDLRTTIRHQSRKMRKRNFLEQIFVLIRNISRHNNLLMMTPFRLAEVAGQLCKFVDENIRPGGNESRSIAQAVRNSTSQYARATTRLDVRFAIPNYEGMGGQD